MPTKKKERRSWPSSLKSSGKVTVTIDPVVVKIAEMLTRFHKGTDGKKETRFSPDLWLLQDTWKEFWNELSFQERLSITNDMKGLGWKVMLKLLSIDSMSKYERTTRNAIRLFEKKVFKNTKNLSSVEGFKYLIAFYTILQNGPKLTIETEPLEVDTSFDGDKARFDIFGTIDALSKALEMQIKDKSIDLDLLVAWVDWFEISVRATIKNFCEIPLSKEEMQQDIEVLDTANAVRHFKEKIFPYGPWFTTTALIFTGVSCEKIDYGALYKKLEEIRKNDFSFNGISHVQKKSVEYKTYFSGLRAVMEWQITRQRWLFTDLEEVACMYVYLREQNEILG